MSGFSVMIYEIDQKILDDYSKIPIRFIVESIYELKPIKQGLCGVNISEVKVEPYEKDYDTIESNPSHLLHKFNLTNWRVAGVFDGERMLAGAIIAHDTDGINMLEGKKDLVVLWDIRVRPEYRGLGLGTNIVNAVKSWAKTNNCTRLKIETQNINVKACNFYANQGATLSGYNRFYYNDNPKEIQFIWSVNL